MEFDYTVTTAKNFELAVKCVQEKIAEAGLRVLHVHDIKENLAGKGFKIEPFKIIEFCSAQYANDFLQADIKIGLCMPCKINVYAKNRQIFISGMRPLILPQFFPEADLGNKPQEIDQIIQDIINKTK